MCADNEFIVQQGNRFPITDIIISTFFAGVILIIISVPGLLLSRAKWCSNSVLKFIFAFFGLIVYAIFASLQINESFGFFFVTIGVTFFIPYAYFYNKITRNNSSTAF
jgi:hypothetical protein